MANEESICTSFASVDNMKALGMVWERRIRGKVQVKLYVKDVECQGASRQTGNC